MKRNITNDDINSILKARDYKFSIIQTIIFILITIFIALIIILRNYLTIVPKITIVATILLLIIIYLILENKRNTYISKWNVGISKLIYIKVKEKLPEISMEVEDYKGTVKLDYIDYSTLKDGDTGYTVYTGCGKNKRAILWFNTRNYNYINEKSAKQLT